MNKMRTLITGATAVAIASAGMFLGGSAAHAAGTVDPAITNDPNAANGSIAFYNASGNRVYSGPLSAPFASYAVASTVSPRGGTTKATLFVATPDHTKANSATWFNQGLTAASSFPLTTAGGAPASVVAAEGSNPAVAIAAGDGDLGGAFAGAVNDPTTGYDHVMQVRLEDAGTGKPYGLPFWATDVYIDTTAGTWTQLFPAAALPTATTISAMSATPASPAPSGTTSVALSANLSATDSSHPAGSVELFNGATDLGPATLNAGTGAISATATVADSTDYSFKFKFTPSGSGYASSSSAVLAYHVNGAAAATTTKVAGPTTATVGSPVTYTATVTPAAAAGTVQFKINGTNSGSPVAVSGGTASFTYTPVAGDTAAPIVVTAAFAPTNSANYNGSTDATGVTTTVSAPAYPADPQNVTVTVPQGTLVISTPYTVANPFKLGTLALSADGTHYSVSNNFGDPAAAATTDPGTIDHPTNAGQTLAQDTSNGVTITDTRAGSTGWTASVSSTNFTNASASSISAHLFSFTNVTPKAITGNNLQVADITTTPVADLGTGGPFAHTAKGPGTIAITGKLGLDNVPTSVLPGDYTATLTFTIA